MPEACKRHYGGRFPAWLPETYNLVTELPEVWSVTLFEEESSESDDNYCIFVVKIMEEDVWSTCLW